MADWVLDASAVLALMRAEAGVDRVLAALPSAQLASVNAAEVVARLIREGVDAEAARAMVVGLGCPLVAVDAELGLRAGALAGRASAQGLSPGLSLGGRCCLALAERDAATALTADPTWARIGLPIRIATIR
jgi:PIN domain nuclease of toxin-antitoxin system